MSPLESASAQGGASTNAEDGMTALQPISPNCSTLDSKNWKLYTPPKYGWKFYGAFASLCVINFVCAIDATILSVALPPLAAQLDGTAMEAFWTGTSFLLTSTVFQPSFASLSHILGRKPVLLAALALFTIGSIICSAANDFNILLAGRSIQGIGGGGLVALTYVITADLIDLRNRGKWQAFVSLQWALGSILGPVLGGSFVEKSWRWIFIFNFPFIIIGFFGIVLLLKLNQKLGSVMDKLKNFDWIGSFIFVASTTSLLIPLSWGGVMFEWTSWRTVVPLVTGVLGLIGFIAYSKYIAVEPLIRGSIFTTSTAKVGYFGTVMHGIIVWAILYYMPLYYEVAHGFSPVIAGVALFPLTFTSAPAAIVVGLIITKFGRYRLSVLVGWGLTSLGCGLLIILKETTSTPKWIFLTLVVGGGTGILYSAQSFAVQASASNEDLPFAAAMYSFFRSFGQAIGVCISGSIFQNQFKAKLLASSYPQIVANAEEYARDASALVQIVKAMPDSGMKSDLVAAYVDSLQTVWIVLYAIAGVAYVASLLWVKDISLDRTLETEQGFIHNEKSADEEMLQHKTFQ